MGRRSFVAAVAVHALLFGSLPASPAFGGGAGCPEIKSSSSPTDPSYVHGLFWDVHGCQVPLREGVGHIPWQRSDFGYQHIEARRAEGDTNHELTAHALSLWANAMVKAGMTTGRDTECHQTHYTTPGGRKRTMRVLVDYKMFEGYKYKGIITAYWVNGHRRTC